MIKYIASICLALFSLVAAGDGCPDWLDVDVRKLRSDEMVNLCELKRDKVLLIVNTASECGFTPQFKGLEALYQKYGDQGLEIVGFPSDSFRQEHDSEEKTAEICYVNYGVTFPVMSTSPVKGETANPVFAHLGETLGAPKWNFYKYLIGRDGQPVAVFDSRTKPESEALVSRLEESL